MPSSCAESLKGWRQDGCEKHGEIEAIDFNGWTDGDGSKRIKNHHEERQCRRRNLAHTKLIPYMEAHSVSRKEEEGATIGKAKPEDSAAPDSKAEKLKLVPERREMPKRNVGRPERYN